MIRVGFERIAPTPTYPSNAPLASLRGYAWDSGAMVVNAFKTHLKTNLRTLQSGRCCYCRRHLGDTRDTHLEHFLEKSTYPGFRFEIVNLGLSCSTCNGNKLVAFQRISRLVQKRKTRTTGLPCTKTTAPAVLGTHNAGLPPLTAYRWVHPHHDTYTDHIRIRKSWVYAPHSRKGFRTIRGLKLNVLGELERRARRERLTSKGGAIAILFGAIAESNTTSATDLFADIAHAIRQRRKLGT